MNAVKTTQEACAEIWERLAQIPDPEIPVISITELGVVRELSVDNGKVHIRITPTYTGCPAMSLFSAEILAALREMGYEHVELETVYSPAWTTDWLSAEAREKMRRYGIAAPVPDKRDEDPLAEAPVIHCPRCDSAHTRMHSSFGSTACKALFICENCREPFEYFKHF